MATKENQINTKKESDFMQNAHPYKELVKGIRVYRAENNCTNKDVAKLSGISYAKLNAFICNTRVDDDTARAIAKAIGYGIYAQQ